MVRSLAALAALVGIAAAAILAPAGAVQFVHSLDEAAFLTFVLGAAVCLFALVGVVTSRPRLGPPSPDLDGPALGRAPVGSRYSDPTETRS